MANREFGLWRVLREGTRGKRGERRILCRCVCGTQREVRFARLKNGASRSCGCRGSQASVSRKRQLLALTSRRRGLAELALARTERLLSTAAPTWEEYASALKQLSATRQMGVRELVARRWLAMDNPTLLPISAEAIETVIRAARAALEADAALPLSELRSRYEEGRVL